MLPLLYPPLPTLYQTLLHLSHHCPTLSAHWALLPSTRLLILTLSAPSPPLIAVFGEHGRELITTQLALHIIRTHCHTPPSATLILIPVANPSSYDAALRTPCARLNANDVDLNRNYPTDTHGRSDNIEEPPGRFPFSEAETRIIDAVIRHVRPVAYVSVHSGDRAVLVPFDDGRRVEKDAVVYRVGRLVQRRHCMDCRLGTASELFGYKAYGTAVDYVYGRVGVPVVLTVEIYGDAGAHVDDCRRMFNPGNVDVVEGILQNWSGVLDTVLEGVKAEGMQGWGRGHLEGEGVHGVRFEPVVGDGWLGAVWIVGLVFVMVASLWRRRRWRGKGRADCGGLV